MTAQILTAEPLVLPVMALAVIILGLSKGGFAGIGMVSTPMVAAVTDPLTAAGLMLPILLVQDQIVVLMFRRRVDWGVIARLLPGGAAGVIAAYLLASVVPGWAVEAVLGLVSVLFALWQLRGAGRAARGSHPVPSAGALDRLWGALAGLASGFTSSVAHAGTPPFQIYVMPRRLSPEVYVGTSVIFFAALNLMKLPSFVALGLFGTQSLKISALFVPLAIAASWAGAWLVKRIDAERFRNVITLILLLIGLLLLWQAACAVGLA